MPQVETDRAGESAAPVEQLTREGAVVYHVTSVASGTTALGANHFSDNSGASFRVWAPNARAVNVRLAPSDVEPFQTLPLGRSWTSSHTVCPQSRLRRWAGPARWPAPRPSAC